jgi:hypothetical protein
MKVRKAFLFLFLTKIEFAIGLVAAASALQPVPVIIGGSTASPHSQKYILSLQRSGSHFCGGSLGDVYTKGITAAHCYYSSGVTAVAGAHNIKNSENGYQQKKSVTQFVKHPSFGFQIQFLFFFLKFSSLISKKVTGQGNRSTLDSFRDRFSAQNIDRLMGRTDK